MRAVAPVGDTGGVDVESPEHEQGEATRIRVVLADDSVLLREGIASLLDKAGFEIVGQSGTAEDLLLKVRTIDRKSTRLNSSHGYISYAVFCLKKKKKK